MFTPIRSRSTLRGNKQYGGLFLPGKYARRQRGGLVYYDHIRYPYGIDGTYGSPWAKRLSREFMARSRKQKGGILGFMRMNRKPEEAASRMR